MDWKAEITLRYAELVKELHKAPGGHWTATKDNAAKWSLGQRQIEELVESGHLEAIEFDNNNNPIKVKFYERQETNPVSAEQGVL